MKATKLFIGRESEQGIPTIELFSIGQQKYGYAILTLDMDFGTFLAMTGYAKPSVIQIRREDVSPEVLLPTLLEVLRRYSSEIEYGALIVIDAAKIRLRMLPLKIRAE